MMKEPQEPGRSVAPMTATDLGLRNTFSCSFADTVFFLSHVPSARRKMRPHRMPPWTWYPVPPESPLKALRPRLFPADFGCLTLGQAAVFPLWIAEHHGEVIR